MLVSNSDNHKQNCEFAEGSIAYLYGELDEAQSAKFSLHLKSCSSCADELSAFSSIHSSIQNWKSEKFDVLSTPIIKIPTDLQQKSDAEVTVSSSWLANLRERFSFPPGWVQVGAFAALAICLGFGLFFISSSDPKNVVVENPDSEIINNVSPDLDDITKIGKSNPDTIDERNSPKSKDTKSTDSLTNVQVNEKNLRIRKSASSKVSTNRRNSEIKEKSPKQPLNRKNKAAESYANAAPANNRSIPKLNNLPEEAEDEDLRLADLFDEIDAG